MNKPILEKFLDDFVYDDLPECWHELDVKKFGESISALYNFQEKAVKNIIKTLYLYFKKNDSSKDEYYKKFVDNGYTETTLDIDLSTLNEKLVENYKNYFLDNNNVIAFSNFVNRLSIWMATGSGKTLVMVKLLEILGNLMNKDAIPRKDILIMAPREDLLDQIKSHVDEFNTKSITRGFSLNLKSLSEFDETKKYSLSPFMNEINIFYYRSDLISDEQKENQIDFKNYENDGNWYVILDEAHKGNKDDSKRQLYYSIFARNGFMFNFSAVFVEPIDEITNAYNFNLEKFIKDGFGKHISIQNHESKAFNDEYSDNDKQIIILKSLLLLTYIKKQKRKLDKIKSGMYHEPLLLTLVNSVNLNQSNDDSDLKLFFIEIEKIAKGEIKQNNFKSALKELTQDFENEVSLFYEETSYSIDVKEMKKLTIKHILKEIFNSTTHNGIEVKVIPGKEKEAIFKLKGTAKYFAVIKIGNAFNWIKENLRNYVVVPSFDGEDSAFANLDERKEISILMGSRAFYEGWDSTRPNLILFINIGVGKEAKKFVIQSIGRGVRIEPLSDKRKRLLKLSNNDEDENVYEKSKELINELETVFIFGTKISALQQIIGDLKQNTAKEEILKIIKNPNITEPLLIPIYKKQDLALDKTKQQKFSLSETSLKNLELYQKGVNDKILVARHGMNPDTIKFLQKSFQDKDKYFNISQTQNIEVDSLINSVVKHFNIQPYHFDKFQSLDDEINHYKKIVVSLDDEDKIEELKNKILKIQEYRDTSEGEKNAKQQLEEKKITLDEFTEKIKELAKMDQEESFQDLKIKNIANHLTIPMITSVTEKVDYIKHIISTPSEIEFLKQLETFVESNKIDVDSWTFSRIDEYTDNIHIPYYDPRINELRNFYPDFIFWLKKGKQYKIVFVDPKGIGHTDYEYKVDEFKRLFGGNNEKMIKHESYEVRTSLYLHTVDANLPPEGYKKYWIDNVDDIFSFNFE